MAQIIYFSHVKERLAKSMSVLNHARAAFNRPDPEGKATKELNKYDLMHDYPINPLIITKGEGVKVIEHNFNGNDISGIISKQDDNVTIYINRNEPPARQKFTIAHELGHLFLHMTDEDGNFLDNSVSLYRTNNSTMPLPAEVANREAEANRFAAALLMPKDAIEFEWLFADSVEEMAKTFEVSEIAMKIRLKSLGIIK
ncbi:ImmA/IrrE family metallo-endopeptidase [Cohnella suwonensis]|uniref:ImmA/IrrE family metallo-endopeptidase n=1 Tax=Cohnella suwonensis TaxID=696072 RepID=A0ABW0M195_9BACL